jgi:hypothetical protein
VVRIVDVEAKILTWVELNKMVEGQRCLGVIIHLLDFNVKATITAFRVLVENKFTNMHLVDKA